MRYPSGQPVQVTTVVTDLNGVPINPSALSLTVARPDGTQQTYSSPVETATGYFYQDLLAGDLAQLGHYQYAWTATGVGAGVARGDFDVFDPFEPAILSFDDAKDILDIASTTTVYDKEIQRSLDSIQALMENFTGGPIITRSITEQVECTKYYTRFVLRKGPIQSIVSVVDMGSGNPISLVDVIFEPNARIVRRKLDLPFVPAWSRFFQVTYTAGWGTAVPPGISEAASIILQHLYKTKRGPGLAPVPGLDETLLPGMAYAVPHRAAELLVPYRLEVAV